MAVASVGIILGSLFSSGMMEVARSGMFYPQMFTFHDVMLLFLTVMLTNVILLDLFQYYGVADLYYRFVSVRVARFGRGRSVHEDMVAGGGASQLPYYIKTPPMPSVSYPAYCSRW